MRYATQQGYPNFSVTVEELRLVIGILFISGYFYGRERIGESNYHDSQGEFWPKLKQCLTDWTKEALPQSFRTRAF